MKILLIGDAESIWIKRYVENVLLGRGYEITLLLPSENSRYYKLYNEYGVKTIIHRARIPVFSKIPKLRGLLNNMYFRKLTNTFLNQYDVIHIHYMSNSHLKILPKLHTERLKVIGSFWGSDLLRKSRSDHARSVLYFPYVDHFTVATTDMYQAFEQNYGNQYLPRLKLIKFGISGFDSILAVEKNETRAECKIFFGIDPQKQVITLGYNASMQQQHLSVLRELAKLPKNTWHNIVLLLPMTYGKCSKKYKKAITDCLVKMNCKYIVLNKFMSDEEIARLCLATDIFIHAQTTDAMSASVLEQLFSGTTVLNPKWISYLELKEKVDYIEYENFEQMAQQVKQLIANGVQRSTKNRDCLRALCSWEDVGKEWISLYNL